MNWWQVVGGGCTIVNRETLFSRDAIAERDQARNGSWWVGGASMQSRAKRPRFHKKDGCPRTNSNDKISIVWKN
jgi:uncharacterized membrane protein